MLTTEQYQKAFEALKDINMLRSERKYRRIAETNDNVIQMNGGEYQGNHDTITEIYEIQAFDVYVKLTLHTDSYGDNEKLVSVQLVRPVVKQVQDFEVVV